jgi:hypothetical protein
MENHAVTVLLFQQLQHLSQQQRIPQQPPHQECFVLNLAQDKSPARINKTSFHSSVLCHSISTYHAVIALAHLILLKMKTSGELECVLTSKTVARMLVQLEISNTRMDKHLNEDAKYVNAHTKMVCTTRVAYHSAT